MGTIVRLDGVRVTFPHLFKARSVSPGDDPKFGCGFIIPKNHPALPNLLAAIEAEKAAKWGANVPPSVKSVLYDGDTDPKYNAEPANHGSMVLNTSAPLDRPPLVVDQNVQKVMDPSLVYAGCYVNVEVGVFSYDQGVSKGIAAGLNGVQFAQDGEPLGNVRSAEAMFGAPPAGVVTPGAALQQPMQQPVSSPYAPPAPVQGIPQAPPAGAPTQAPPVAPQPPGVPPAGLPPFAV